MQYRFGKSKGSVSKKFGEVLEALFSFAHTVIWPKDENYSIVHHKLSKYSPYFDGCIGALDGTHIPIEVSRNERDDYINRTGRTTQHVLAICDFGMQYTYIGVGMARANHDMAVLKRVWGVPNIHTHREVSWLTYGVLGLIVLLRRHMDSIAKLVYLFVVL